MRVYFLGIGGIGMSAIARYLNLRGDEVMGYDRTPSELTHQLQQEGIQINYEDTKDNVPLNLDLVIYTPAIPTDSQQMQYIQSLGIPMEKRSVALGHITKDKKVLAVSGTHGKTTTCGMITTIMANSPVGCSAFLGGILKNIDSNFLYNAQSPYVVVEADEYDRSFLHLTPYASVITAIDPDHMDIYHTYDNLHKAFEDFACLTNKQGMLFVKSDKTKLINDLKDILPLKTYSLTDHNAWAKAENITICSGNYHFDYVSKDETIKDICLNYPGRHNIENAVAAITICSYALKQANVSQQERIHAIKSISTFSGMKRRLEYIIKTPNQIYIDDYAHHPQEIRTTINSLRELYPDKKFTGIFQPHLYTRTRDLCDDFAKSLSLLDTAILLPIYPARELPIEGVTSKIIYDKITCKEKYLTNKADVFTLIKEKQPHLLITFGAGDIDRLVPQIAKTLQEINK